MSNVWEELYESIANSTHVFHELKDLDELDIKHPEKFVELHKKYCKMFFTSLDYTYEYVSVNTARFNTLNQMQDILLAELSSTQIAPAVLNSLRDDMDDTEPTDVFSLVYSMLTGGLILFTESHTRGARFLSGMLYVLLANGKLVHPMCPLTKCVHSFKNVFGRYRSITRLTLEVFQCLEIDDIQDIINSTFDTISVENEAPDKFVSFLESVYEKEGMCKVAEIIQTAIPKCTIESLQNNIGTAIINAYNEM